MARRRCGVGWGCSSEANFPKLSISVGVQVIETEGKLNSRATLSSSGVTSSRIIDRCSSSETIVLFYKMPRKMWQNVTVTQILARGECWLNHGKRNNQIAGSHPQ